MVYQFNPWCFSGSWWLNDKLNDQSNDSEHVYQCATWRSAFQRTWIFAWCGKSFEVQVSYSYELIYASECTNLHHTVIHAPVIGNGFFSEVWKVLSYRSSLLAHPTLMTAWLSGSYQYLLFQEKNTRTARLKSKIERVLPNHLNKSRW